jgi:protocatechuate 3,4-dioxygenase beta subunit
MKTQSSLRWAGQPARLGITLLAALVMAACSGQTATVSAPPAATHSAPASATLPTATEALALPSPQAAVVPIEAQPTQPQPTRPQPTQSLPTAPALACTSPVTLTPAVTEGPYFKANSPERASLIGTGIAGTRLTLTGYVLTADCKPVAKALLDFWQADAQGVYDNSGYTLRGHQFTDANGRYQLETVIPGIYTGRTEHIHVKVQAPNGPILTSQLFFPNVAGNQSDSIYNPALLIKVLTNGGSMQATFNFIISSR